MSYRVFRYLVIGSICSLLLCVLLLLFAFRAGQGGGQLQQIVQQIAGNQSKLISGAAQVGRLLNLPPEQYLRVMPGGLPAPHSENMGEAGQKLGNAASGPPLSVHAASGSAEDSLLAKNGNPLELAFYDALRYLEQNLQQERAWEQLNRLLETREWQELLKKYRLRLERSERSAQIYPSNTALVPRGQAAPRWFDLGVVWNDDQVQMELSTPFSDATFSGRITFEDERNEGPKPSLLRSVENFFARESKLLYNLATEYQKMYTFLIDEALTKKLAAKNLYIESLTPKTIEKIAGLRKRTVELEQKEWELHTKDGQLLSRFYFDIERYVLLWNDKNYQSLQLLRSDWNIFLANVDVRSAAQQQEDKLRRYLIKMLADSAFVLQMAQYGLRPAPLPPREDEYYEYYDLLNSEGQRVASFALQKRIGEAYLMDRDDVKIRSLKSFLNGAASLRALLGFDDNEPFFRTLENREEKKLPGVSNSTYYPNAYDPALLRDLPNAQEDFITPDTHDFQGSEDVEVILLTGTHDNMADVMILLSIYKQSGVLSTVSLPRDLYYRGQKINAVYSLYGPQALLAVIRELTGLAVSRYISVDMYAFIELVDLIGGIDIYLEEALIDPSYKIKQMGKWQTLVLRKGQHHLDGLGALRYSRSRHSRDDFDRSERQQQVLNQLVDKLREQMNNPKKLLSFLQVVQKYVDTNFRISELARYWLAYSGYRRNFGNTISTQNILYYTFTNYLGLDAEELKVARQEQGFFRGAYILLPKAGDWSLIRKYIMDLQNVQNFPDSPDLRGQG